MRNRYLYFLLPALAFLLSNAALQGQNENSDSDTLRKSALKIFLDCRNCDMNYTRQEIPYVNYVRDVREAEVYVLVTDQNTGSGGRQYTYTFLGQGRFKGMSDTLVYTANPDLTSAIIREKRTALLKMGLIRYVVRTPMVDKIEIRHSDNLETQEVKDKWNNWVFEFQTSPRFNAEESYRRLNLFNSINISRITPDIKLEIEMDHSLNRQRFIQDDYDTTYIRKGESAEILLVRSLGEHWSAGVMGDLRSSTEANYKINFDIFPSVEYDLFPYSAATHKQLRILYGAGYQYSSYLDSSIYNLMSETRFKHMLRIAYQVQEKWGSVNLSLTGSNYLHDFSKNRLQLEGFVRIRIIKGLSFSINGDASYVNDRLNLRKGNLTEAERLLRLKQQATRFVIGGGISINYTFGSIYSNIVNPRFGNGGGGGGYSGGGYFY